MKQEQLTARGVYTLSSMRKVAGSLYVWGHLEKRNQDMVVELNLETMSEMTVSAGGE